MARADAEAVAVTVLTAALDPDVHVGTRYAGTLPAVVVQRIGGIADTFGTIDRPRLDIEAWAGSKEAAYDLAESIRQAVWDAVGSVHGGVTLADSRESLGLQYVPDSETEGTPRYLFTVEWTFH